MVSAPSSAVHSGMRMVAATTIGIGVALLGVVAYLLVWTGHETAASQDELKTRFQSQLSASSPNGTKASDGIAVMRIPKLGADWEWVVVEGISDADLARGPGHFPGTAYPGQIGNFAVAGHRATHGQPFADLNKVTAGASIEVQTSTGTYTYRVTSNRILPATATDVIAPVAGQPGVVATASTLTLVTCHPRWSSARRMVVTADLISSR